MAARLVGNLGGEEGVQHNKSGWTENEPDN
jgi:hypothetical protein